MQLYQGQRHLVVEFLMISMCAEEYLNACNAGVASLSVGHGANPDDRFQLQRCCFRGGFE
jgi:hypothetical protein